MKVSSPDRVIFPGAGLTKADVVQHYEAVGDRMLAFLADRPLTLQRFPRGIAAKGFMQKNAAKHFPETIARYPVAKRDGTMTQYPVVHKSEDIAYLANQGTITFHMWTSTVTRPNHPDWLVLDLDPEEADTQGVRFAAQAAAVVLDEFGLNGMLLATGSKGFHIWVPLDGAVGFEHVSLATRALAGIIASRHSDKLTTEFLKKDRAGRVFVDWLRNTSIATVVVPFSLRPRPGAPMAVPLRWDELPTARPGQWSLTDHRDRLDVPTELPTCTLEYDMIMAAAETAGVDLHTPHDRFGRKRKPDSP